MKDIELLQEFQTKLIDIQHKLSTWRELRRLSVSEQQKGFVSNLLEELTEYSRATNDIERIDALCDIIVFTLNAHNETYSLVSFDNFEISTDIDFARNILSQSDNPSMIVRLCCDKIISLGYNPYKCMLETIKEISSRTGHYDEKIHKFIKDKGAYSLEEAMDKREQECKGLNNYSIELSQETETVWILKESYGNQWDGGGGYVTYVKWHKADYESCH